MKVYRGQLPTFLFHCTTKSNNIRVNTHSLSKHKTIFNPRQISWLKSSQTASQRGNCFFSSSTSIPAHTSTSRNIHSNNSNNTTMDSTTSSTGLMKNAGDDGKKNHTNGTVCSKRGLRAVSLLPTYLSDARSVQLYNKFTCPNGALQVGVAETRLMQDDWNVPALATFQTSDVSVLADSIYYQPTSGRFDAKVTLAKYIEDVVLKPTNHHQELTSQQNQIQKKLELQTDGLIIGAGCNAVLENLCYVLTDPGDSCLIPTPYYAAFEFDLGSRANVHVIPVETMKYHHHDKISSSTTASFATSTATTVHDENPNASITTRNTILVDPTVYYPTIEALDAAYNQSIQKGFTPKILLLSHPHNPLGISYPPQTIQLCIEWCRRHSIHLISDEIYAGSVYGSTATITGVTDASNAPFVSALRLGSQHAETPSEQYGLGLGPYVHWVYALSKDYGLSGLRVGVAYTENRDIILPLQKLNDFCQVSSQTQLFTCNMLHATHPNPQQGGTSVVGSSVNKIHIDDDEEIDFGQDKWYRAYQIENHKRLRERVVKITQLLQEYNIPYIDPTAGLFIWIDLSKFLPIAATTNDPERSLYLELIERYGLLLTPGQSMKNELSGYFRFVFTAPTDAEEYELSLSRFRRFFDEKKR